MIRRHDHHHRSPGVLRLTADHAGRGARPESLQAGIADALITNQPGVALLAPGGALFLGDLRDLRSLRAFRTAIALRRGGADVDADGVRAALDRAAGELGFVIERANLEALGLCPECRDAA